MKYVDLDNGMRVVRDGRFLKIYQLEDDGFGTRYYKQAAMHYVDQEVVLMTALLALVEKCQQHAAAPDLPTSSRRSPRREAGGAE